MNKRSLIFVWLLTTTLTGFAQTTKEKFLESGKYDLEHGFLFSALENFNNAIALDSLYADAYYYRAKTYLKGEHKDYCTQAYKDCQKCIKLDPTKNYWEAYYYLGQLNYCSDSSYISYFDKIINMNPDNIEVLMFRSTIRSNRQNFNGAMSDLNRVIGIEPKNIDAIIARSTIYIYNKQYKLGLHELKRASKIDKTNPLPYYHIALLYHYLNQHGHNYDYCKYFKKAVSLGFKGYIYFMKDCGIEYKP
jgi:Tfp pilus assembly protein PilF